ncbi:MAG: DNA polymerase III subunit delta [Firmicutes bacterium]|nr:DNA polymerase III subunit delta [Bacillota bacterium]
MQKDLPIMIYYGENEYELNNSINNLMIETGYALKEINDGLDFQDLIDILNTPSLFEGNLIYKITNDSILNDDRNFDVIKEYLASPSPFSKGVIIAKKIDFRKKAPKFFKENKMMTEFPLRKGGDLRRWVKEFLWHHGYNITEDAVAYLIEVVGENQIMIENEMKKIFIYEPDHKNLVIKDLDILITNNFQSNIFNLLDNMFTDRGKMISALENLFKLKEPIILIIYMIIRDLRLIVQMKWYLKEKYNDDKIASLLKMHPYVAKKKIALARKLSFAEVFKYLQLFYDIEEKIKSGRGEGKLLLKSTLLSIK